MNKAELKMIQKHDEKIDEAFERLNALLIIHIEVIRMMCVLHPEAKESFSELLKIYDGG